MKLLLLAICLSVIPIFSMAQDYRGENKVFVKFEKKDKTFYVYESDKSTIEVNKELNSFTFNVNIDTFTPIDSSANKNLWDAVFPKEFHNDLSYKGDIPLMEVDMQSDKKQLLYVSGIFTSGDFNVELPLKLEWSQMDRFVFVDFNYILSLKEIGVVIPENYQDELTGNLCIAVLNAKLIGGFE